ncbi:MULTISPECIES: hypothetical protein [Pseudomonas]|uniref:Uncharacterized protein n=1 Tax=Pseudomonas wuhanensis TaxID=2954098 RepID=A0ABY9GQ34_9PSED|nr:MULTISPECIES: hypothetical protein [unclassified Pseudomonas]WLI11846.1 hypothetical protein PSH65_27555 [Pseudomonas sp. FP603]WLI17691.1 hypothetical protein PSH88_26185 [Pseudomonas sp. FP607]
MTAQLKTLSAPQLREAIKSVLFVDNLIDPAHGEVPPYANATVGDKVEFTVQTSTGNSWTHLIILTQALVGSLIVFDIPKNIFEKNLTPDATATLRYSVTSASGNTALSPDLLVKLEK